MQTLIGFLHLLSLACWIGAIVFFSFFAAPAVFKTLDRPQAGELVGVLFPRYYFLGYICSGILLLTLLLGAQVISVWKLGLVAIIILGTFTAGMGIQPRARNLKAQIKSADSEASRKPLEARFQTLHSLSVKLNAMVLFAGLALLWLTARGLAL